MHRRDNGMLRADLGKYIEDSIENTSVLQWYLKKDHSDLSTMTDSELSTMTSHIHGTCDMQLQSAFCIIPEGDTVTSRRLFDSIAAGCIPVIFARQEIIGQNLPFRKLIDWAKVAVFAGDMHCALEHHSSTIAGLKDLLAKQKSDERLFDAQRLYAQAVFRDHLSYAGHGIVTSILCDVNPDCGSTDLGQSQQSLIHHAPGSLQAVVNGPLTHLRASLRVSSFLQQSVQMKSRRSR